MNSSFLSKHRQSKHLLAWLISILIHLIVMVIGLYPHRKDLIPPTIVPPVHLQLHEIKSFTANGKMVKSPEKSAAGTPSRRQSDSVFPAPSKYAALLPAAPLSAFEPSSPDSSRTGTSFRRETQRSPTEQMPMDRIASKIKLPLRWRGQADEGKAVAHLALEGDQKVWIRSLYGEPVMRASLYECLRTEEMRSYVKRLMIGEKRKDFSIVLRFIRVAGTYRGVNNEAVAYNDGVEITKTLPAPMRQFSGVPLSDSHSKRADLVQQLELEKLMESPSFCAHHYR